jgi:hypothetical protein
MGQANIKNKTLCEWSKSDISKNKKILFTIIKTPLFYCKKCARSANEEIYLCKPERIK